MYGRLGRGDAGPQMSPIPLQRAINTGAGAQRAHISCKSNTAPNTLLKTRTRLRRPRARRTTAGNWRRIFYGRARWIRAPTYKGPGLWLPILRLKRIGNLGAARSKGSANMSFPLVAECKWAPKRKKRQLCRSFSGVLLSYLGKGSAAVIRDADAFGTYGADRPPPIGVSRTRPHFARGPRRR